MNKIRKQHKRYPEIPAAFADATLAAAIGEARGDAHKRARAKAARQSAHLLRRGELSGGVHGGA